MPADLIVVLSAGEGSALGREEGDQPLSGAGYDTRSAGITSVAVGSGSSSSTAPGP